MRLTFTLLTFLLVSTFGLAQNVKFNDTFDDDKNTDFISKLSGLSERKKYRIRMYNADTAYIRLEKKIKITLIIKNI